MLQRKDVTELMILLIATPIGYWLGRRAGRKEAKASICSCEK